MCTWWRGKAARPWRSKSLGVVLHAIGVELPLAPITRLVLAASGGCGGSKLRTTFVSGSLDRFLGDSAMGICPLPWCYNARCGHRVQLVASLLDASLALALRFPHPPLRASIYPYAIPLVGPSPQANCHRVHKSSCLHMSGKWRWICFSSKFS
ncbi:hypothetical protein K461DRAFT_55526 [Myriangium duriaei CBS 260.36]|uniref:Uncharacterized protein n=1 Tax=Myriangium duriaei CBS 260.36 TaxID=1168546 RepID=A0A9P4IW75_9PEZI|nr:hypothetical protein K461DRAFT_55526 [Myriangium duriaei CBS 260.36]